VHRNLVAYSEAIGRETGQQPPDPVKIVSLMVDRFIATDRASPKRGGGETKAVEGAARVLAPGRRRLVY
jgi:hypothetical protein